MFSGKNLLKVLKEPVLEVLLTLGEIAKDRVPSMLCFLPACLRNLLSALTFHFQYFWEHSSGHRS